MELSHPYRLQRTPDPFQKNLTAPLRYKLLRHDQHHQKYLSLYVGLGIDISEERKDKINQEIAHKEIRVLDFTTLLNFTAQLKKEKDDINRGDVPE